jgi:hypothetical protein
VPALHRASPPLCASPPLRGSLAKKFLSFSLKIAM